MKRILLWIAATLIAAPLCAAGADWAHQAKEPIERRLTLDKPGAAVVLDVDNVLGAITVNAADVSDIRLTATRLTRATNPAALEQAAREVRLDVSQKENRVRIYVDGPFRDNHGRREPDYTVRYDFQLTVPRRTDVRLRTVTDGDIRVDGIDGAFDVANVNGAVQLTSVAGCGRAHTVNGAVRAGFRNVPGEACDFRTVNGDIDLRFPAGLNADFRLQTLNGEAWSDFAFTRRASAAPVGERRDGRTRIVSDRFRNLRVGQGGPTVTLETVNGDMTIARQDPATAKTGE